MVKRENTIEVLFQICPQNLMHYICTRVKPGLNKKTFSCWTISLLHRVQREEQCQITYRKNKNLTENNLFQYLFSSVHIILFLSVQTELTDSVTVEQGFKQGDRWLDAYAI